MGKSARLRVSRQAEYVLEHGSGNRRGSPAHAATAELQNDKEPAMPYAATLRFDLTPPSDAQREALAAGLSDQEREVLLHHGTEAPFCGVFLDEKRAGV